MDPTQSLTLTQQPANPWYVPQGHISHGDLLVAASIVIGAITWVLSNYKDRKQQKKELRWRQLELLYRQAELFDTDPDISAATKILTGNNVDVSIDDLFNLESETDGSEQGESRHKMDKLLNLLERVAYANQQGHIDCNDITVFGWYFKKIKENSELNAYCGKYYPEIIAAAKLCDWPEDL